MVIAVMLNLLSLPTKFTFPIHRISGLCNGIWFLPEMLDAGCWMLVHTLTAFMALVCELVHTFGTIFLPQPLIFCKPNMP